MQQVSHSGKGVDPDWCLSLVPKGGLHAISLILFAPLLPNSYKYWNWKRWGLLHNPPQPPMWEGHSIKHDFPACRGNLPRSCPSAHKEERLTVWVKHRMWERDQLSLEWVSLSWQEPALNIHIPGGKHLLGVVGRTIWRKCQQGQQGPWQMWILWGHQ